MVKTLKEIGERSGKMRDFEGETVNIEKKRK